MDSHGYNDQEMAKGKDPCEEVCSYLPVLILQVVFHFTG